MHSLGFGLERLGYVALRAPLATLAFIVLLTAASVLGLPRLLADDALSELFRANTPEFKAYERMSNRFPASEFDVLVVVEGADLLTPEQFERVRSAHLDLELADGVAGVLSVFSMRDPPDESGFPPPMIPDELPEGASFDELMKRVAAHPLLQGRFLSISDGTRPHLTVLVVSLNRESLSHRGLDPALGAVGGVLDQVFEESGLTVTLSGAPVMQREIREAIRRDRVTYNAAGLAIGILICWAFFRRLSLVLVASVCPILSVVWAMGALGWMDQKLNTFINVIPPLVMVIAFSDAMHMVFAVRRHLAAGHSSIEAARHATATVGPACVLTSLTTAVALLTLTFTDSAMIRQFGLAAAFATALAFIAVMLVVPMAAVLLYRDTSRFVREEGSRSHGLRWLQRFSEGMAGFIRRHARAIAVLGVVSFVAFTHLHLQLEPHYRLSDEVPGSNQSVGAAETLEERLTGAHPLHIMIAWKEGLSVTDAPVLDALADAHRLHEAHPSVGNVWSVETLRRWLAEIGVTERAKIAEYLALLPQHLTARFYNPEARSALVTGRLPSLDADEAVPIMRDLDARLDELRKRHPDVTFTVTGLAAVSALQSASMIRQLNFGLFSAVAIVMVLIALAFRSLRLALLSFVPNLFPIVAAGAFLYFTADGLAYASVIALTVGFGLAVDCTIHFLARLQREQQGEPRVERAVTATIGHIGPVLILTTLVLIVGLAVTMASDLPSMQLFGKLTVLTLAGALFGDLVILPAIVSALRSVVPERNPDTG
ncbi:MAG: MMPL family transporter [Rhizobiales bacterium]|nr:MMPL family transporter [Hyphomicrobiales bacterium]